MASRTGMDEVLQGAVDRGDVPLVVAMAADRDGVIYEGAAGERVAGHDLPHRVDDEDGRHRRRAAARREAASWTSTSPSRRSCPEFGELMVLEGFDGDAPRMRQPASKATVRHS